MKMNSPELFRGKNHAVGWKNVSDKTHHRRFVGSELLTLPSFDGWFSLLCLLNVADVLIQHPCLGVSWNEGTQNRWFPYSTWSILNDFGPPPFKENPISIHFWWFPHKFQCVHPATWPSVFLAEHPERSEVPGTKWMVRSSIFRIRVTKLVVSNCSKGAKNRSNPDMFTLHIIHIHLCRYT